MDEEGGNGNRRMLVGGRLNPRSLWVPPFRSGVVRCAPSKDLGKQKHWIVAMIQ